MAEDRGKFEIGPVKFAAFGDRILIQEDEFKSGYECEVCGGTGVSPINPNMRCKTCEGKGGLIVVPEISQRRPTTGTIVSIGEAVKWLKPGQSVLYSSFAGHTVDLDRAGKPLVLRILHESEVLSLVDGHLELRTVRGKSEIAINQG